MGNSFAKEEDYLGIRFGFVNYKFKIKATQLEKFFEQQNTASNERTIQ